MVGRWGSSTLTQPTGEGATEGKCLSNRVQFRYWFDETERGRKLNASEGRSTSSETTGLVTSRRRGSQSLKFSNVQPHLLGRFPLAWLVGVQEIRVHQEGRRHLTLICLPRFAILRLLPELLPQKHVGSRARLPSIGHNQFLRIFTNKQHQGRRPDVLPERGFTASIDGNFVQTCPVVTIPVQGMQAKTGTKPRWISRRPKVNEPAGSTRPPALAAFSIQIVPFLQKVLRVLDVPQGGTRSPGDDTNLFLNQIRPA